MTWEVEMGAGRLTFILVDNVSPVLIKSKLEDPPCLSNISLFAIMFVTFYKINHIEALAIHILIYFPVFIFIWIVNMIMNMNIYINSE